jgi:hypothetical protein
VDSEIAVDNETAVKLGCLELRRFFKDMPQVALKKKENFDMLEKDIGLEKFFKSSLLSSLKRKNLRTMVLHAFQNYESLTMEGCIFQFFSLLSKFHSIDVESFQNCAVGVSIYLIPISPHAGEESVLVSGMSLERSCTTYYYWPH